MVEVVLLQDVKNLGKKGDVVEVKDGYAVNYLIPRGLARRATEADRRRLQERRRYEEKLRAQASVMFDDLENVIKKSVKGVLLVERKVSPAGTLYDALDSRELNQLVVERIHPLMAFDKVEVIMKGPIKKAGRHVVELEVHYRGDAKRVPLVVEVASAEDTPRLKSEGLDEQIKKQKKKV